MRHVHLTAFEDEPTGSLGLGFLGYTSHPELYADREGGLIAHDIVEHQNGIRNIGSPQDELEAMGGYWFARGQHGYTGNPNYMGTAHDAVGKADIITIAEDTFCGDWTPRLGAYRTHRHDYDEDFHEIIDIARKALPANFDPEDLTRFPLEAFLDNALHLMRIGFNKARRRFGDGFRALDTFEAIKRAVAPHAKHVEYSGQQFLLSYGNGRAFCHELEPF